jgi:DNA topoisomerase VI subunit A
MSKRSNKRHLETGKKLEGLAQVVIKSARARRDPGIEIPTRALSNSIYDEKRKIITMGDNKQMRSFFNLGQAKKFMQTMLIASGCKELNEQAKTTSIRDLFYHCKHTIEGTRENTFDEQSESDPIIEDLEVAIGSLREELGLFAENKGSMVGAMTIVDDGDTIDLRRMGSGGWSVPSMVCLQW